MAKPGCTSFLGLHFDSRIPGYRTKMWQHCYECGSLRELVELPNGQMVYKEPIPPAPTSQLQDLKIEEKEGKISDTEDDVTDDDEIGSEDEKETKKAQQERQEIVQFLKEAHIIDPASNPEWTSYGFQN